MYYSTHTYEDHWRHTGERFQRRVEGYMFLWAVGGMLGALDVQYVESLHGHECI